MKRAIIGALLTGLVLSITSPAQAQYQDSDHIRTIIETTPDLIIYTIYDDERGGVATDFIGVAKHYPVSFCNTDIHLYGFQERRTERGDYQRSYDGEHFIVNCGDYEYKVPYVNPHY